MRKHFFVLAMTLLLAAGMQAQVANALFHKGDRVCFVGNSITFNGGFHHDIFAFYATRFPGQRVDFFNCGIGGDVTAGILRRMETDILVNNPTCAVIKIGMNDIYRNLYTPTSVNSADTAVLKEKALQAYRERLEQIIKIFLDKGVRVIMQTPSIYDQTSKQTSIVFPGCNDALKICAGYVKELAAKYKLVTVDYWTILNRINLEMQEKDPAATIIGRDRVHPGTAGNFIMAYEFLHSTGAPQYVSQIIVSKKAVKGDASITKRTYTANGTTFTVLEKALPFPLYPDFKQPAEMVPFINEMDQQLLQVDDLANGNYKLTIDTFPVGTYSAAELHKGINLAVLNNTPQMKQAADVYIILQQLWKAEADTRLVKQIEMNPMYNGFPDKNNIPALMHYLDSINSSRPNPNATTKKQLVLYADAKAREAANYKTIDDLRNLVYRINQPVPHVFKLEKQ